MRRPARLLAALNLAALALAACGGQDEKRPGDDDLSSLSSDLQVCGKGPTLEGIDVSEWQGSIDWNQVAGSGKKFAITRIGDGTYKDPTFATNWAAIKRVGMIRGAYQFFEPNSDAATQANIVVAAVGKLGPGDLPVTLDVETPSNNPPAGTYAARIQTWIDKVKAGTGKTPIIYTGYYYWRSYVVTNTFANQGVPLWHAQYTTASCPTIADAWKDWIVWQYSSTGRVPGISGNVDMDRFNGTLADLQKLADSNSPPKGYLDTAACSSIGGWAQDPDAPAKSIDVHLYIDGPAGDPKAKGFAVKADKSRADLCGPLGSCDHAYDFLPPLGFLDGKPHVVYAYGIDSAGGANSQLADAPKTLKCSPPKFPWDPAHGVKRHVTSPQVMTDWKFDGVDVLHVSDADLAPYTEGPVFDGKPNLVSADGDPGVYIKDGRTLHHVPDPAAMDNWQFTWGAINKIPKANLDGLLRADALSERPFVVQGSGPEVWIIDGAPALWAVDEKDDLPATLTAGSDTKVTVTFRNRGSAPWNPGEVFLAPVEPHDHESKLCGSDWANCGRAATVSAKTAPGDTGTFTFTLHAPEVVATVELTECFGLVDELKAWFSDSGQMGPSDKALCRTFKVSPAPPAVKPEEPPAEQETPPAPTTATQDPASEAASQSADAAPRTSGCGCSATAGGLDLTPLFGLAALALRRRRRA